MYNHHTNRYECDADVSSGKFKTACGEQAVVCERRANGLWYSYCPAHRDQLKKAATAHVVAPGHWAFRAEDMGLLSTPETIHVPAQSMLGAVLRSLASIFNRNLIR